MQNEAKNIFLPENLKHLPAARKANDLIDLMKENSVIVVEGETGSGKSVVLPNIIAQHYGRNHSRVIVTQNRRLLCESLATFVSESMGQEVGNAIGYHFKGEKKGNYQTRLSFEPTGTVLGQLKTNPMLSGIQCIVVDEVHEGSVDQHILLSHLKRIVESNPSFRIVLMSATLSKKDKKRFTNFFNVPVGFLQVEGRSYPVKRRFTGHRINYKLPYQRLKNQVVRYTVETIMDIYNKSENGTILAFFPGKGEIAEAKRLLSNYEVDALSLHANTDEDEKQKAVSGDSKEKRIVLCTEVARSGLTVEGVQAVISSGYARVSQVANSYQVSGIRTTLTDWASLKQEGGRTGRTCPGQHYIVGTEEAKRANNPDVALQTTDISGTILNLLSTVDNFSGFEWFVSPGNKQMSSAIGLLKSLGAIKSNEGKGWKEAFSVEVTPLGNALSIIPANPQIGKLLLASKELGVEKEGAIIASFLLNKVKISRSWSKIDNVYSEDMTSIVSKRKYENDLEAIINEYKKGSFDDYMDGCVTETVKELLSYVSEVDTTDMELFDCSLKESTLKSNLDALKIAVISSFGHLASVFVPADTILEEMDYRPLNGNCFYNAPSEKAFKFNSMKASRYSKSNNRRLNGLILIPLNLFHFEDDITCSAGIEVSMKELESLQPLQGEKLATLCEEIGTYKDSMTGKNEVKELSNEEKLLAAMFAKKEVSA